MVVCNYKFRHTARVSTLVEVLLLSAQRKRDQTGKPQIFFASPNKLSQVAGTYKRNFLRIAANHYVLLCWGIDIHTLVFHQE